MSDAISSNRPLGLTPDQVKAMYEDMNEKIEAEIEGSMVETLNEALKHKATKESRRSPAKTSYYFSYDDFEDLVNKHVSKTMRSTQSCVLPDRNSLFKRMLAKYFGSWAIEYVDDDTVEPHYKGWIMAFSSDVIDISKWKEWKTHKVEQETIRKNERRAADERLSGILSSSITWIKPRRSKYL